MNILIVANEFPYPANHGGKADIFNRILAFKNAGHKVFLVTWQGIKKGNIPCKEDIIFLEKSVDKLIVFDILRNLFRFISLLKYPSLVGARLISDIQYTDVLNKAQIFKPDFIFVDGIYGAVLAQKLKKDLSIPLGIRLHNIENIYMKGLLPLANGFKAKLSLVAACLHLRKYENNTIKKSDAFFDISIQDLKYWKNKGFNHGFWLPTTFVQTNSNLRLDSSNIYDIGFLGNLNTPNNVEGIKWFVKEVMPVILGNQPSLKIIFLGSDPNLEIKEICSKHQEITLIANPKDTGVYLDTINVLINPVKFGSGVNIKSVEMLMRDNPVVSTSIGIKGMPIEISNVFFIADSPEQFSDSILNILHNRQFKRNEERMELRKIFQENSINIVITEMRNIIKNKN